MIRTAKFIGIALALSAAGLLSGCSSADPAVDADCTPLHASLDTLTDGVLTIGVPDSPPLISPTGEDGFSGIDADIIRGFAATECLSIDAKPVAASSGVTSVEQGRIDTVLGGWYRTAARNEVVPMGYPMYLDQVIIVSTEAIDDFDELKGLKVGAVEGYMFVDDLKALYGDNLSLYSEPFLVAQDLKAGRLDAAVDIATGAVKYEGFTVTPASEDDRVAVTLQPGQTSLPFNKSQPELRAAFDEYIQSIHVSGELAEILSEWGLPAEISDVGEPYFL